MSILVPRRLRAKDAKIGTSTVARGAAWDYFNRILLAAYVLSIPVFSYQTSTAGFSTSLGILLAGSFFAQRIAFRRGFTLPIELGILGVFLIYNLVGGFVALEIGVFLARQATMAQLWLFMFIAYNLFGVRGTNYVIVLRAFQVAILIVALPTLTGSGEGRFAGALENPNTYGMASLMALAISLLIPSRNRIAGISQLTLSAFMLLQIANSGSRKAIIGAIMLLALYLLLLGVTTIRNPPRFILVSAVTGSLLLGTILVLQESTYWYRVENLIQFSLGEQVDEGSVYERQALILDGLELWERYPLIGVGVDQFQYHMAKLGLHDTYSHSNPVEILTNFGVIGAAIFYGAYVMLTVRLISAWFRTPGRSSTATATLIGVSSFWLTWVTLDLFWVSYLSKHNWLAFLFVLLTLKNLPIGNVGQMRGRR